MALPDEGRPPKGSVRLVFLARYRELAGQGELLVPLEGPVTLADFLARLRADVEGLDALPPELAVAVNRRVARPADLVSPGDELAFLPPVAGG